MIHTTMIGNITHARKMIHPQSSSSESPQNNIQVIKVMEQLQGGSLDLCLICTVYNLLWVKKKSIVATHP